MQRQTFNILSLDGGGIRGIIAAKILANIQDKLKINIYDTFDLIVGTSTGSIIAAAIASNKDLKLSDLARKYEEYAPRIFKKKKYPSGYFKSKYNSTALKDFLRCELTDITLGQIDKPLIINATNLSLAGVHLFKSKYQERQRGGDYIRDGEVPLYKAVLASCAAPTYFDPVRIGDYLLCDGGLWANNPSLVGYTDAIRNFQKNQSDIKILSIGTGLAGTFYTPSKYCKGWGLLTGWRGRLVDIAMNCSTQSPQNHLDLILSDNILRLNPSIEQWELDDCGAIPTLSAIADAEITHRAQEIENFMDKITKYR